MNKIFNKILLGILCVSLIAGASSYTKVYATNDKEEETTVETETVVEDEITEDEIIKNDDVLINEEETEVDAEEVETTPKPTQSVSVQNSKEHELVVDGQTYSGEVWVVIKSKAGRNTALKNGTEFTVEFEDYSFNSGYRQKVTLNAENKFSAMTQLPVGEYYITTSAKFNGLNSDAKLILSDENNSGTVLVLTDNQEIDFTIIGDVSMETEKETPTPEIVEEKQDSFIVSLLKNNIFILIILAGLGITLLVYRLKRDNQ